jgi:hypothetical protein
VALVKPNFPSVHLSFHSRHFRRYLLPIMSPHETTENICESLLQAITELQDLEDRQEPLSQDTRNQFSNYFDEVRELATQKGYISRRSRKSHSPSTPTEDDIHRHPDPNQLGGELANEVEQDVDEQDGVSIALHFSPPSLTLIPSLFLLACRNAPKNASRSYIVLPPHNPTSSIYLTPSQEKRQVNHPPLLSRFSPLNFPRRSNTTSSSNSSLPSNPLAPSRPAPSKNSYANLSQAIVKRKN